MAVSTARLGTRRAQLASRRDHRGGYGLLLTYEPIGRYKARDWPGDLIGRCPSDYVARYRLTDVVAFAAATSDYGEPLRWTSWPTGVRAWLLSPVVHGGGAQRRTPTVIGQAIVTLVERDSVDHSWTAADGTRLAATPLQWASSTWHQASASARQVATSASARLSGSRGCSMVGQ